MRLWDTSWHGQISPVQMTSERHQMLAGLDSRNFAAPIRQILAGIAAHAIGAPIARVLTQPGPEAVAADEPSESRQQSKLEWPLARVVSTVRIRREISDVFEFFTTPKNWPEWHPASISVAGAGD